MRPADTPAGMGGTRLWTIPATAGRPQHNTDASPSCFPTGWESSLGGEPGEQDGVGDAGLAPDMDDRELARTEEPGKGVRAHAQPPLRFGEGNQLRRRGQLQGEFLLPRGRAHAWAEASGRRWHRRGFPSQAQVVRRGG
jgi:hypothetical protein